MEITQRDKKLLVCLFFLIIIVFSFNFGYRPLNQRVELLTQEKNQLEERLNYLNEKQKERVGIEEELAYTKNRILQIDSLFPSELSQDDGILFVHHLEEQFGIKVSQIGISNVVPYSPYPAQAPSEEESNITNVKEDGMRLQLNLNYTTSYLGIKQLVGYLRDLDYRIVIDTINVSANNELEILTGSMNISLYGIKKDEVRRLPFTGERPIGNDNLIVPFHLDSTQGDYLAKPIITDYDVYLILNPITSDVPAVAIGKRGENASEIHSDKNSSVNLEIEFSQQGDKYFVSYKLDGVSYPRDNRLTPISPSQDIKLSVKSKPRTGEADKSGVNVSLINKTDKAVTILRDTEDLVRPRFQLIKKDGQIID